MRKLDAVCSEVKMHRGRTRYWKAVVASLDESVDTIKVSSLQREVVLVVLWPPLSQAVWVLALPDSTITDHKADTCQH